MAEENGEVIQDQTDIAADASMALPDEDEEETKEHVFTVNTLFSRNEKHTLREVCRIMDWREATSEDEGDMYWYIDSLKEHQKLELASKTCIYNRYPKASIFCYKREFHLALKKFQKFFPNDYDFIPETFVLPDDFFEYKRYLETRPGAMLLAKPSKGRGGQGIFFVKDFKDLEKDTMKRYHYVAQEYIPDPFLIENKKFDFRMYLMITGVDKMEAFIAFEGLTRFCTEEYKEPKTREEENEDLEQDNLMGHLTNYCLNKDSDKFVNNNNFKVKDDGTKRLLTTVLKTIDELGVNVEEFKANVKDICAKLMFAFQPHIINHFHIEMGRGEEVNQNVFHIFGLDIMLDESHKPWVLEINAFPAFSYFFERFVLDPVSKLKKKYKAVSELDKYMKSLILKQTIQIVKGDTDIEDPIFEKVFPPEGENALDYLKMYIYNDVRKVFEHLAGNKKPDYINSSQFLKIANATGKVLNSQIRV